jgi:hypothetical protein
VVYWSCPQDNSRKVLTFRGLSCGKACLSTIWITESFDFCRFYSGKPALTKKNLRRGMPFRGIIHVKFWLPVNYTLERHTFPRKVKFHARISPRIREYILNNYFTFIRSPLGVDSWIKETKNLMLKSL